MKLFKRFFLLKKGIGAAAVAIGLFAFASCENMTTVPTPTMTVTASKTLYAPTFPEKTDENGNPIANLTYGERYYTVSQGLKRKISLSWNPVEIAKYYEVFAAQNINDTFIKVGESQKSTFEDSVSSGMTYYYKVRAVNTKGECSDFSPIVKGTSLATPAITEISITDTEAKIFWYMGNVGVDSYVKDLVYEVHAFKGSDETIVTIKAWDEANQSVIEDYTFENLTGNSEYLFRVDAYITSDQTQIESSPKVSEKTLALYTPVSPEFATSQGESVECVKLAITLPPKVQVALDKENIEDSPICFEIQRKRNDSANWQIIIPCLYFTGKTEKPTKSEYDDYAEGKVVYCEDKVSSSAISIVRGIKYDYRIVSCVDLNYFAVNNHTDYKVTTKSKESLAKIATGWVAFNPKFEIKKIERILNSSNPDLVSNVRITFNSSWDALGKDDLYKFAIQQTFQKDGTTVKGTSWLKKADESKLFDSAADVNAYIAEYDLSIGAEFLKGVYQFALYIIPKDYTDPEAAVSGGNYLTFVADLNNVTITTDANVPNTDIIAEGGWTNKTEVSWFSENNVSYSLKRTDISNGGTETTIDQATILTGLGLPAFPINEKVIFADTSVESGHEYAYELVAVKNANTYMSSIKAHAKTLGIAVIAFGTTPDDYSYNTVKVSWPVVMAAKTYDITLGEAGKFGGGKTLSLNEDGSIESSNFDANSVETKLESDTITLTITNPEGYDDALLSGSQANLTVNSNSGKATTSKPEPVWTIGPASAATRASDDNGVDDDSIIVKWKGIKGAVGYAVYRTRQAIQGSTEAGDAGISNLVEQKTDVYYISADGTTTITANGEAPTSGAVSVSTSDTNYDFGTTYTLTDKYHKVNDNTKKWQVSQSYIGLGIKYNYTVLPVLKEDDAKDVEALDASAWSNNAIAKMVCPQYEHLDNEAIKKDGYTMGYGLNLEATKAEYTDRVVLMWDKPANIDKRDRHPIIYYRKRGSSSWNKIVDETKGLGDTTTSTYSKSYYVFNSWARLKALDSDFNPAIDINGKLAIRESERLESFEFAVSYNSSFGGTSGIDEAYINYVEQIFDKRITTSEAKNVGYLFSLPGVSGSKVENNDYSETVTWQKYNAINTSVERAVEPDSYAISLKNLNNGSGYKTLVTYDKEADKNDAKITSYANVSIAVDGQLAADRTVTVTPSFNTTGDVGVHNGLLKVQRDYKHWYRLTATKKSKADYYKFGDITDGDFEAPDSEITTGIEDWACRKISDQEFAKCIGLIICDAINQGGVGSYVGEEEKWHCEGAVGKFHVKHQGGTQNVEWGTYGADYQHIFRSGNVGSKGTALTSGWTLKLTDAKHEGSADGYSLYFLSTNHGDTGGMAVTHESSLPSYSGTVDIRVGDRERHDFIATWYTVATSWTYTFEKNSAQIISVSNDKTKMQLWFPFEIGASHKNKYTSDDASLPEYQGTWWQEQ